MNYQQLKEWYQMADLDNKTKLETVAAYMRECAADPTCEGESWFTELMPALAEWLDREAGRSMYLGPLDSGYEMVNYWESPMLDPDVAEAEPCIRVANIFLDHCVEAVIEEEAGVPS